MFTLVLFFWFAHAPAQYDREIRYMYVPNLSSQEECLKLAEKWLKLDEFSGAQCRQMPTKYL